jgi:peptide/nickel transport system substrate-binding protein
LSGRLWQRTGPASSEPNLEEIVTSGPDPRVARVDEQRISRTDFLKGAAGVVGLSSVLAACGGASGGGGGSSTASTTTAPAGAIRKGGTLRLGYVGAGTAETLNPNLGVTPIDQSRIQQLYDPLTILNPDLTTSPGLGLDWTPNKDATEWEVKLRPGVTFHNGKPLTAQDVIYSIRLMSKPTSAALPFVSGIKLNELKAVNSTTLRIPLKFPDGSLQSNFVYYNTWIVQDGEKDFSHPVGTGPFKFESFTPGQQSLFSKNANYWMTGKPYVDAIKIASISDDSARLNALLSGQIDAMAQLPYAQAKAHQATGDIVVLVPQAPQALVFYFDVTKPPFNDNRVRTAMKLIANRPQLVSNAISGFGTVGNDIIGKGLPLYDTSLPQRVQDISQAKSLLKAAGHENLQVTLKTSQIIPGFVESATLYAQQATAAGVKVTLQQVAPDSYFNPSLQYLKLPFGESQWPVFSLKFFYLQSLAANAPYNETHWHDPAWNTQLSKAIGELDQSKAQAAWNQVQQIQYQQGGYMCWTNADYVDGVSKKVEGLKPNPGGILGNHDFRTVWLSA